MKAERNNFRSYLRFAARMCGGATGTLAFAIAVTLAMLCSVLPSAAGPPPWPSTGQGAVRPGLPYVYTNWRQFTVADGLPNDHIFAVAVDDPWVWVGTEDGLARIDKRSGEIESWNEEDGLPWRVVSALAVEKQTGDLWVGMFGGGLARFSGGRFDHWHQLNSGLVNDVVYGVALEHENVWVATTAGANRFNTLTGEWDVFTEKNAPMEEIWNYAVTYNDGKVYVGVWGSGVLEWDVAREQWKAYLDPDGEMEIDLYRDDGIVHVITTGVSYVDQILWAGSYFAGARYDGRSWRGYYSHECGLPSDFINAVAGRSADEAWYATDKGVGVITDFATDTWVTYTLEPETHTGRAVISRGTEIVDTVEMGVNLPHNYALWTAFDGDDVWIGTSKGLAWGIGEGYYAGLRAAAGSATSGLMEPVEGDPGAPAVGPAAGPSDDLQEGPPDSQEARPASVGTMVPTGSQGGQDGRQDQLVDLPPGLEVNDPVLLEVLAKINSVSAYEVPDLGLRQESNYAHTAEDVEPFSGVRPFKEHFLLQMEYTGPGRAIPEPEHLESVKVGFIGPIMSTVSVATGGASHEEPLGIQMLRGVRLAIEEANAQGGYLRRRIPFELVVSNDNGLWGSSGNEIIKLAYRDRVWGILGTIDGANSHIAIRVALKAEVVMVNTGDTDPTFIETNIPWVARTIGDDRQQGYLLVDYLYRKLGHERIGILRANNRYARFGVREIRDGSRRLGYPIALELSYPLGTEDFSVPLDRLQQAGIDALVHWGDAEDGARLLNQMRARGMDQPFFASDRCVSDRFVEVAGENAEGVVCAYPWNPQREDPRLERFRQAFHERFGVEPDTYAAHAYDGMSMLLWSIQVAGLNRAKIRDVLAYRSLPWPGVTGDIVLSAALDDVGEVFLARFEDGDWRYYSRADLDIPRGRIPPRDRVSRGIGQERDTGHVPGEEGTGDEGPRQAEPADGTGPGEPMTAGARAAMPPAARPTPSSTRPDPYFVLREHQTSYQGPGRDEPEPEGLEEVLLGYFGPSDPDHPRGGDMWLAASIAVEEANAEDGFEGLPFRLVPAWSENPWGTGVRQVTRLAYEDRIWGLIGSIDSASTHLAEQVIAKARLPLVSPASTDNTVNLANVAWTFSLAPGDHLSAPLLAAHLAQRLEEGGSFALISATDHDSRLFVTELQAALVEHELVPRRHLQIGAHDPDVYPAVQRALAADPEAVIVVAGPADSARLVHAVAQAGFSGLLLGGPSMGCRSFVAEAGPSAERSVFPLLVQPMDSGEFAAAFEARAGHAPDYTAVHTYDATRLLIEAIRVAGLNRSRIRDALAEISPWYGISGVLHWDPLGQNQRSARLGTIRGGGVVELEGTGPRHR